MKVNNNRLILKAKLSEYIDGSSYSKQTGGLVLDSFRIYLYDGTIVDVGQGNILSWSNSYDEDDLSVRILQTTQSTNDGSFMGFLGALAESALSNKIEIEWNEIRNII